MTYALIGLWNRWRGNWGSVFFCYAGSRRFIDSYALPGIVGFFRWRPSPIGVMRQDGVWGLVLAAPVTEADFLDPDNVAQFQRLQQRIARIARLMGVETINLAGILPGVLRTSKVLDVHDSRPIVVRAVLAATDQIAPEGGDVILLGGAGRIGKAVAAALVAAGWRCHVVDPQGAQRDLPDGLSGRPALLIDVSRRGAIGAYIPQMWPGLVVLNEVFPAPSRRHVAQMIAKGVTVHHLAGVAGQVIPPLPHGYESAIPCCAARATDGPPDIRIARLSG